MRKLFTYYRGKNIKANSGRYFDGIVHNCCRVSAANNNLAFAIHRVGVFGGPVIEQILQDIEEHMKPKIYHPNCKECEFWVYHDSVGGWHCESGFRPLVRDDWPYDCRRMARANHQARIRLSGGFIQLKLF